MEERECDVILTRPLRDLLLGLVQRQSRADRSDILGRVGVAEHDLEATTGGIESRREIGILDDFRKDAGRRLQVRERLEQRDDVEHGGSAVRADGCASQAMNSGKVVGRLGERHDVAAGRTWTVSLLDVRDRAHDVECLLRHVTERLARLDLSEHLSVHCRMLPYLELGEMKAKGLDLPDELLQFAIRMPKGTRVHERLLNNPQVVEQLRGIGIGKIGVAGASSRDASAEQQKHAPVRFVRRSLGDFSRGLFVGRPQSLPERQQRIRRRGRCGVESEAAPNPVGGALEPEQHVFARNARRLPSD